MSYPINNASPLRVAVGAVVQISDGAVQGSGVSISILAQGQTTAAGGGTTAYENGIVVYTPTQAETNYTAFIVVAYKTGCIPASVTVVTSASGTAGRSVLADAVTHGGATALLRLGSSSSEPALHVTNSGGDAARFAATSSDGDGIESTGAGAGMGMHVGGGATGNGLYCVGGATSGSGIRSEATTSGDGMTLVGVSGYDLNADIHGTIDVCTTNTDLVTAAAVRSEIDSNSTQLAAIVADTNELQTDWANGGRLDLLLDAILDDTGTSGVVVAAGSKTGYALTSGERNSIATALLDLADGIEPASAGTERTLREAIRLILAACAGKASGLATTTANYRDTNDTKNRISATVDADGNRTAVTLDDT